MKSPIMLRIIKLVAVIILLQTLFFKFSAAEESVYIFSKLGMEPFGRIGSGIVELIACVLILIPRTTLLGALIGFGTMLGAILSHLLILGISVKNDGGELFTLAIITLLCCAVLIFQERRKITGLLRFKI
ncbi:DoxX family protein [Flavobacterium sp.]